MSRRIQYKNIAAATILALSLAGAAYEAYQYHQQSDVNRIINAGEVVKAEGYQLRQKFSYAYAQAKNRHYKHAIQAYGQMLEKPKQNSDNPFEMDALTKSTVQFNVANSFFRSGLQRAVNPDGSMHQEAMYSYTQAKRAYRQALKTNPDLEKAKFNLSLLLTIMPGEMKMVSRDQSSMVISNLPQGLP